MAEIIPRPGHELPVGDGQEFINRLNELVYDPKLSHEEKIVEIDSLISQPLPAASRAMSQAMIDMLYAAGEAAVSSEDETYGELAAYAIVQRAELAGETSLKILQRIATHTQERFVDSVHAEIAGAISRYISPQQDRSPEQLKSSFAFIAKASAEKILNIEWVRVISDGVVGSLAPGGNTPRHAAQLRNRDSTYDLPRKIKDNRGKFTVAALVGTQFFVSQAAAANGDGQPISESPPRSIFEEPANANPADIQNIGIGDVLTVSVDDLLASAINNRAASASVNSASMKDNFSATSEEEGQASGDVSAQEPVSSPTESDDSDEQKSQENNTPSAEPAHDRKINSQDLDGLLRGAGDQKPVNDEQANVDDQPRKLGLEDIFGEKAPDVESLSDASEVETESDESPKTRKLSLEDMFGEKTQKPDVLPDTPKPEASEKEAKIIKWDSSKMSNAEKIKQQLVEKYDGVSGKLSDGELRVIDESKWGKHSLMTEAAEAFVAMNSAFRAKFDKDIEMTDSYRSLEAQETCYNDPEKRNSAGVPLCATPGKSNHGWGMALDLGSGINKFGSKEHLWMQQNAGKFGFYHQKWARQVKEQGIESHKPEAWHWEYIGIGAVDADYSQQPGFTEAPEGATASKKDVPKKTSSAEKKLSQREIDIAAAEKMSKKKDRMGRAGQIMAIMLRETKLTPGQISGVLGNLDVESAGLVPSRKQFGGGPGRGLAQWEVGGRFESLNAFAAKRKTSWKDLETQVLFLIHELETHSYLGYSELHDAKKVSEASSVFLNKFERPRVRDNTERAKRGNEFYAEFDSIRNGVAKKSSSSNEKTSKPKKQAEAKKQGPEKLHIYDKKLPGAERVVERAYYYAEHPGSISPACNGVTNCKGLCAKATAILWGHDSSGYHSAATMRKSRKINPSPYDVPVGALLHFRGSSQYEHVAVKVAPGKVATNMSHKATYEIISFEEANRTFKYLGWSKPSFSTGKLGNDPAPKGYTSKQMLADHNVKKPKDDKSKTEATKPKSDKKSDKPAVQNKPKVDPKKTDSSSGLDERGSESRQEKQSDNFADFLRRDNDNQPEKPTESEEPKPADDFASYLKPDHSERSKLGGSTADGSQEDDKKESAVEELVDQALREAKIDALIDQFMSGGTSNPTDMAADESLDVFSSN